MTDKQDSRKDARKRWSLDDILRRDDLAKELEEVATDKSVRGAVIITVSDPGDLLSFRSAGLNPLEVSGIVWQLQELLDSGGE